MPGKQKIELISSSDCLTNVLEWLADDRNTNKYIEGAQQSESQAYGQLERTRTPEIPSAESTKNQTTQPPVSVEHSTALPSPRRHPTDWQDIHVSTLGKLTSEDTPDFRTQNLIQNLRSSLSDYRARRQARRSKADLPIRRTVSTVAGPWTPRTPTKASDIQRPATLPRFRLPHPNSIAGWQNHWPSQFTTHDNFPNHYSFACPELRPPHAVEPPSWDNLAQPPHNNRPPGSPPSGFGLLPPPPLSAPVLPEQHVLHHQIHPADLPKSEVPQSRDDMAAGFQRMSGDARRYTSSNFNRSENRPPMSNVLCRNGPQCRKFQEGCTCHIHARPHASLQLTGTCSYNHDFSAVSANGFNAQQKKSLNVDSPAFTPTFTAKVGNTQPAKMGISPKAATAAAFTPRGSGTVTPAAISHSKEPSGEFIPQHFQPTQQFNEFVPGQSFISQQQMEPQGPIHTPLNAYSDPFLAQPGLSGLDGTQQQINPYAQQATGMTGQQYFQDPTSYKHPLNYHLYSSIGPRRENLMAYQRATSDFFIPDHLREDLQRKSEATLQTFANSTLPPSVEYFHSLVALDTTNQKGPSTFGYPSWVYKATSSRDGHTYALRRIEGFRLTNEAAIRTVQNWKRISNGSLVQVHDAFTGRWFNDSSLIVVTDYHPLAQTVADKYFAHGRHQGRPGGQIVPENDLWSYIVQLASALKAIHEGGQAAQTVLPSKVLITSKNRLRLNGCAVLDIVQYEQRKPVTELQRADLEDLGKLIIGIAARNQAAHHNAQKSLDFISRSYTERLRACIAWLLTPPTLPQEAQEADVQQLADFNVNTLLNNIADKVIAAFDSTLHLEDELTANMMRELENGRLVRLLTKLNVILERPESSNAPGAQSTNPSMLNQPSSAWSETGERYYLKLFRDYVFHQVDHDGRPVLDLGHIITCLNKLDAGIDEKIQLVSRDEQNVFIVTYREVKRGFESAWAEISKASNAARR